MQFKKYIACVVLCIMSMLSLQAQSLMPETLPSRPTHQNIVKAIPSVPVFSLMEKAMTAGSSSDAVSYNVKFGENVVKTALQYLGARYRYGSTGPHVFDCSGFTGYVYGKRNVSLLRTSQSQYTQGTAIKRISDLKKGDLVFFGGRSRRRSVGHVGIVSEVDPSGNHFSFVHASIHGVKVSNSAEKYYKTRYIGARRIVEN